MPHDGSGNFTRVMNWTADAAGGIKILASRHDTEDQNFAAGLSNVICKDGQSQPTADIPFNGKKITNLATPTAPTDAATKAYVDTATAATAYTPPIGAGMEFWGPTPPPKWLLAHGQAISRVTYSALFAIMGTTYGTGDGSTTFNMPDVRGRVVAGKDNMGGTSADRLTGLAGGVNGDVLGGVGGAQSHTLTIAEMPGHQHSVAAALAFGAGLQAGGDYSGGNSTGTGVTGGGLTHNNMQPTIVANYIIYAGV